MGILWYVTPSRKKKYIELLLADAKASQDRVLAEYRKNRKDLTIKEVAIWMDGFLDDWVKIHIRTKVKKERRNQWKCEADYNKWKEQNRGTLEAELLESWICTNYLSGLLDENSKYSCSIRELGIEPGMPPLTEKIKKFMLDNAHRTWGNALKRMNVLSVLEDCPVYLISKHIGPQYFSQEFVDSLELEYEATTRQTMMKAYMNDPNSKFQTASDENKIRIRDRAAKRCKLYNDIKFIQGVSFMFS